MKVEVLKGKRQWYYRVIGKNGKTLVVSETFLTKWNAKRAAKKMAEANHAIVVVK